MSPLEAVTHLCAAIQLADGQLDHEEREEWIVAVTELFPEFSEDRADNFLVEAQTTINQLNSSERINIKGSIDSHQNSSKEDDQITHILKDC